MVGSSEQQSPSPRTTNDELDTYLQNAVTNLQNDFVSGARQMADTALSNLKEIATLGATVTSNRSELQQDLVKAVKKLCRARPSMSAAITSCLLRALDEIFTAWDQASENEDAVKSSQDLSQIAVSIIEDILERRKDMQARLNKAFASYLEKHLIEETNSTPKIHILTLSSSSTIRTALLSLLTQHLPSLHLTLTILESRPRCEGASLAASLFTSLPPSTTTSRLKINIVPDSAIATVFRSRSRSRKKEEEDDKKEQEQEGIDIVLLGADRISARGDVSNKMGSLGAVVCAAYQGKERKKKVEVVVLSDGDKIAARGMHEEEDEEPEIHPASELAGAWDAGTRDVLLGEEGKGDGGRVSVFGEWFEWVDAELVDTYITELGILGTSDVEKVAGAIGEMERRIFGA